MAGKRRGNGEGTIDLRSDGRWRAQMTLENGTRKNLYGKTRKEAKDKLIALQHDIQRGLPVVAEKQTLADYLASWLKHSAGHLRPTSLVRYEELVRLHINPTLGKTRLARLTAQQVQALYAAKLAEGLSKGTVARIHATLRRALGEAEKLDLVPRNVATLVTPPSARKSRPQLKTFTPDEAKRFLAAIQSDELEALYTLAITTGMRRGELLALRWTDVDLDAGFLQVRATIRHKKLVDGGGYVLEPPKTANSARRINLSEPSIAALRRQRAHVAELRRATGTDWQDDDMVFPDAYGRAQRGNHILQRKFQPLLKRAGLPLIRFHDLRHTAATLLLRKGVNPKVVSEMLGHTTIAMTLDVYSHVLPDMQNTATQAMNELFS